MAKQTKEQNQMVVPNPFANTKSQHLALGTVEIESQRAIAEVQAALTIAKARPRDPHQSFERVVTSCSRVSFASKAFYSFPRGGQSITGPSIRLAEELARLWGNIDYGMKELSQRPGETEMEAYAWDLETNTRSAQRFTVKHELHTKFGVKELTDPRDIYEIAANQGARRLRSRILAILPPDLVEAAIQQCSLALTGGVEKTMEERVKDMIKAFAKFNVTKAHIEKYLGIPLTELLPEQFAELIGIHNSLKDGIKSPSDYFGTPAPPAAEGFAGKINEQIKGTAPAAAAQPAEPTASQPQDDDDTIV